MKFGDRAVDFEERINMDRMRKYRLNRAKEMAKKHGLDGFLAFRSYNCRYITGIKAYSRGYSVETDWCVLPVDGDPMLFTCGPEWYRIKEQAPWIEDRVRPSLAIPAPSQFVPEVEGALKETGLLGGKIGVDVRGFENKLAQIRGTFVDGDRALAKARMVKNRDEIECLKMAALMSDIGILKAWKATEEIPGIRECDVNGIIAQYCTMMGSEKAGYGAGAGTVTSGPRTNPYYRMVSDRTIRPGDVVILDLSQSYLGYWSCDTRTWFVGMHTKPTEKHKEVFKEAYDNLYTAIRAIRPGIMTTDIPLPEDDITTFSHNVGHGLGLFLNEAPSINSMYAKVGETEGRGVPVKLEANMALAIETYASDKWPGGKFGVRLEENLYVTETGYELMTKCPFDDKLME